ncbi:hypothetical protein ABL840_04890 [Variovorax sp. NFACC27]|uniref:hypothetical protein n=1 Tax=unclassified Variovorax TaxID=663243 RepID=UPI00089C75D9|nr:hypothetical protein SAMN03159371_00113 [Variovorax sp. NFACC28]SEF72693.1 hypothetical protein SAMN03159365_00704 [Variovorax sp. NFACC29]SFB77358.1 hypothetical protein SAMN03159379_00703 [Variovorax sp. NFACC26]SFG76956.1 hypothetical protein SAMN03159447_04826 [Variovorax sp. NFACC27]
MSAATTTKAKPKAPAATLADRTNSVIGSIKRAQAKLVMALEAAEPSSPAEMVLNQLCLSWLPSALEPVFRPSLTKGSAEATYEALFPPLAVIEAVIALAKGTVLEHTLREGHALLDAAHTELDSCGELTKLLPEDPSESEDSPVLESTTNEVLHKAPAAPAIEEHDPYCVILQARDVAQAAADTAATDMHWGIHSLIEKAVEKVEQANSAYVNGTLSKPLHDDASNELAGLLGIIRAVNTDSLDDGLLYAVETLVTVAKSQIDADNEQAAQARRAAA